MGRKNRKGRSVNRQRAQTVHRVLYYPSKRDNKPAETQTEATLSSVKQDIRMIPLEQIVTEGYQRIINMKNVNGIVRDFDPAKLGVLVVSARSDGTYSVLDGQHRLAALRRLGFTKTNCIVLEGMSVKEEADFFRRQNENKQSLRITDTFNASLWAEDEESLQIKKLMDKYGFRFGKGRPMCISAIGALQTILRSFDMNTLEMTLASIAQTWPHDTTILRREMMAGLGEFWHRFGNRITLEQFEKRMSAKLPMEMYQEHMLRTKGKSNPTSAFNKSVRFTCCGVLVDHYNRGLRMNSKNRLDLIWNDREDT